MHNEGAAAALQALDDVHLHIAIGNIVSSTRDDSNSPPTVRFTAYDLTGAEKIDEPIPEHRTRSDSNELELGKTKKINKFGFIVKADPNGDSSKGSDKTSSKELFSREILIITDHKRLQKWFRMVNKPYGIKYFMAYKLTSNLKQEIRMGIPDALRAQTWYHLCQANVAKEKMPNLSVLDDMAVGPRVKEEIGRDIDRTFPRHVQFTVKDGDGQKSLRRLLMRYAAVDATAGYCQGMGFVAGMFLMYMDEDSAFYSFYSTLQFPPTPLRPLYFEDMLEVQRKLYILNELGHLLASQLWAHLEEESVHPSMYATDWLMTLFTRGFPFELVTRVWDVFLNESYKVIYRVCLALLLEKEALILNSGFEQIMAIIKSLTEEVDTEKILKIAFSLKMTTKQIQGFSADFDRSREG